MAGLPNSDHAIVENAKVSAYILNPAHKDGWPKGQFLLVHGFDAGDVDSVRNALLAHGRTGEVTEVSMTPYGLKYRVDGVMPAPDGHDLQVRTIWQIDTGQTAPRFVTMKPMPRRP